MNYLNLGCGERFDPGWTNMDAVSSSPHVIACDIRRGIAQPEGSFDLVYHSHLLEHFPKREAAGFLRECHRVLKPGGIIRVVVPDLEQIAKLYLESLEKASQGDERWRNRYDWIMLELFDQTVRDRPGGEMLEYFRRAPMPEESFVYERMGVEAQRITRALRTPVPGNDGRSPIMPSLLRIPDFIRRAAIRLLLGRGGSQALDAARFRARGEIHQWMYDRYSLARLLQESGFQDVMRRSAAESAIPDWAGFNLDTEPDGTIYKPDSLFMEARKPGRG